MTTRLDVLTGRSREPAAPPEDEEDLEEKPLKARPERLSRDPRRAVARKVELRRSEWKQLEIPMVSGSVDLKGLKSRSKLKGISVEEMLQQRRRDEKLRAAAPGRHVEL